MHARSVTFNAEPGSIDKGMAYVRDDVMATAMAQEGCIGLSMICNRESGRCIVTSAWATEDAMVNSEAFMKGKRERGAEIFGGKPSLDHWEIAVVHRHAVSDEGACVRCTWLRMDHQGIDNLVQTYRMATLPSLEEMGGFCSATLMIDRATGRAVSSATFTSHHNMVASRRAADALRTRMAQGVGAIVTDVHEFELALAHLHVPERV